MKRWGAAFIILLFLTACQTTLNGSGGGAAGRSDDGMFEGHQLMAVGQYEQALRAYTRAAVTTGMTADALSSIGSANLKLGRLHQAETLLRRAVEKDDKSVPAWNNLGVVLMNLGQISEARRVFRIAFGLDNGNSDQIRQNLALAIALDEDSSYDEINDNNFELVRRGGGRYLLLKTPDSG